MSKKSSKKTTSKAAGASAVKKDPDVPLKDAMPSKKTSKGKKPKAEKPAKEKKLSLLDAAAQVLKAKGEAMNCKAMVEAVVEKGLWKTDAPTPEATLYSAILREMKKGSDSRFQKTGRGLFAFNG